MSGVIRVPTITIVLCCPIVTVASPSIAQSFAAASRGFVSRLYPNRKIHPRTDPEQGTLNPNIPAIDAMIL